MNVAEIKAMAAAFAEDPSQTKYASKYLDAVNRANQQFVMDSKALYKDSAIVMVSGTASYDLPTDFMYEKMVVLNGIELDPISRATLGVKAKDYKWEDQQGTPKYYIIDPEEAKKTITLFPVPNSVDAGTSIVLTYYPFPTALVNDTDVPLNGSNLMVQFHQGLAAYAAWLLMTYLQPTDAIIAKKRELLGIYTQKVTDAIQTFGNTKSEPMRWRMPRVR